jgi:prepilin-type N-terminal cleavage/methylation domain-containing protein
MRAMNFEAFADGRHGSRRLAAGNPGSVKPVAGFTLIELLVTLTVGGILAAMAVPAFSNFVQNDRQVGQANSLVSRPESASVRRRTARAVPAPTIGKGDGS